MAETKKNTIAQMRKDTWNGVLPNASYPGIIPGTKIYNPREVPLRNRQGFKGQNQTRAERLAEEVKTDD